MLHLPLMEPKILIAAPTNMVKSYCQKQWIEQVTTGLDYKNCSVFLSDNSSDERFRNEYLIDKGIEIGIVDPVGKSNPQYMSESHEQCRQHAINIGADFLLHWEVDLFTDNRHIIQDLLAREKQVVGAIYHIEQGIKSHLCIIALHQDHPSDPVGTYPLKDGADLMFVDGECKRVFNVGLGCTLIHRSVFTKIKFRYDVNQTFHPDSAFAEDCYYMGIPIYADTSLLLDHQNQRWLAY